MNSATVLELVDNLNRSMETTTRGTDIFNECTEGFAKTGVWTSIVSDTTTAFSPIYGFSSGVAGGGTPYPFAVELLQLFYDDKQLSLEDEQNLDLLGDWRDHTGDPEAYVIHRENDKLYRLYPVPTASSADNIDTSGETFGRDFSIRARLSIFKIVRTDFQTWLAMFFALWISARDFEREGKNRDLAYAQACDLVAGMVLTLLDPPRA